MPKNQPIDKDPVFAQFMTRTPTTFSVVPAAVEFLGRRFRVIKESGSVIVWDGNHWKLDEGNSEFKAAYNEFAGNLHELAKNTNCKNADKVSKVAIFMHRGVNRRDLLEMIMSESALQITDAMLYEHGNYISCLNGTVDLETGILEPPNMGIFTLCHSPYIYPETNPFLKFDNIDEAAFKLAELHPRFYDYIMTTMEDSEGIDSETRQRGAYISATRAAALGVSKDQDLFFIYWGPTGRNGKGVLKNLYSKLVPDAAVEADHDFISIKKNFNPTMQHSERHRILHKRTVDISEFPEGAQLNAPFILKVTGGDKITCKGYYKDSYQGTPHFTMFLQTNKRPHLKDTDNAMRQRFVGVNFHHYYPPEARIPAFDEIMISEGAGLILAWSIFCNTMMKSGTLKMPDSIQRETLEYLYDEDEFDLFNNEFLEPDAKSKVPISTLHVIHKTYSQIRNMPGVSLKSLVGKYKNKNMVIESEDYTEYLIGFEVREAAMTKLRLDRMRSIDNLYPDKEDYNDYQRSGFGGNG